MDKLLGVVVIVVVVGVVIVDDVVDIVGIAIVVDGGDVALVVRAAAAAVVVTCGVRCVDIGETVVGSEGAIKVDVKLEVTLIIVTPVTVIVGNVFFVVDSDDVISVVEAVLFTCAIDLFGLVTTIKTPINRVISLYNRQ